MRRHINCSDCFTKRVSNTVRTTSELLLVGSQEVNVEFHIARIQTLDGIKSYKKVKRT